MSTLRRWAEIGWMLFCVWLTITRYDRSAIGWFEENRVGPVPARPFQGRTIHSPLRSNARTAVLRTP